MSGPDQARPLPAWQPELVREIADGMKALDGALLPILHALQERMGYIDARALPIVAEVLNLSRAEVQGVVSFYHDFRAAPPGRHTVRLCRAEACQAVGGDRLAAEAERALGVRLGATSADGVVTLEPVYCLGNCALGPSALVDGELHGRLTAERLAGMVRR